ncbi:endoglucanase 1 [Paraphoma chrysanthemicola]|uniref:cellulase n=1 Tax=Paraphoma chrysanthemicola TaxID=798071 RepID=A0A8K0VWW5_9PLEO|nr:endoglucanase 1 [Paraphoma chrysanthemicola]
MNRIISAGAVAALALGHCAAEILYAGVNSAGGEFAQQTLPGAFGIDYQFINETAIDFFLEAGVNTIRLPFLLERMCPLETGLGKTLNETYFTELATAVNYITTKGAYVILDAHNYMRYNDPSMQPVSGSVIGNASDPKAATTENLAAFWAELSTRFVINPNVIFGIMNEPHDMPTSLILQNDQAMIDAIRGAGAQQLILVPGNGFTGAQRWLNTTCSDVALECTPNAEVLLAIVDPLNNFAFDMHLYFDNDTSGTHEECTLAAPANLLPVTAWLQENNYTAFLSEFGAGSNPTCFETVNNTINHLESSGVFVGWTYWSAGPLWGDYFLSIEPDEGPQANSTWPEVLEPHIKMYQPMMRCGVSTSGRGGIDEAMRRLDGCLGMTLPG